MSEHGRNTMRARRVACEMIAEARVEHTDDLLGQPDFCQILGRLSRRIGNLSDIVLNGPRPSLHFN